MLRNEDIYEEILRNHAFYSNNYLSNIDNINHYAHGANIACGDEITINICNKNNVIHDISFQGNCCSVLKSSASLMTDELKGKTIDEAKSLYTKVNDIILSQDNIDDLFLILMKRLSIEPSDNKHFGTIKCTLLPWQVMMKAISKKRTPKSSSYTGDFSLFLE